MNTSGNTALRPSTLQSTPSAQDPQSTRADDKSPGPDTILARMIADAHRRPGDYLNDTAVPDGGE